ncbi:MAG: hypothetical protein QM479_10275 [Pseudomonadota bacterium]
MKIKLKTAKSLFINYSLLAVIFIQATIFSQVAFSEEQLGILTYPQAIDLNSPTTGVVVLVAKEGEFYKKSETLVSFDAAIIKSQIKPLKLQLALQKKVISEARREFQRSEELYEGTMLSDHEFKLAEIALLTEQSQLQKLRTQLVKKQWQLKHYQLSAPFDGFVVATQVVPTQYIVNRLSAQSLVQFVAAKDIIVDIKLTNSDAKKIEGLKPGELLKIAPDYELSFISLAGQFRNHNLVVRLKFKTPLATILKLPKNGALVQLLMD